MKPNQIDFSRAQDHQKAHTLEDSISDYRKVYPELTDKQLARCVGVGKNKVKSTIARMNRPTDPGGAA